MAKTQYWLLKTEPSAYSIDDLEREGTTSWDGIRNFQARNILRDDIKVGDMALIYHSGITKPCAVGIARVIAPGHPDTSAQDKNSEYYDPRANAENPIWYMVDLEIVARFNSPVLLEDMKKMPELEGIMVTRRGMRLSIQPVKKGHFDFIKKLGMRKSDNAQ